MKKYSKFIVVLVIVLNSIAFAALLYVFLQTKVEAVVLTGAWFAFTTGELWLLKEIKTSDKKLKKAKDSGIKKLIRKRREDNNGLEKQIDQP